jgi:hypothetical protein
MTTFLSSIYDSTKLLFRLLIDSLSSKDFYTRVFKEFSGYGLKYIFTLMYISTVIVTLVIILQIEPLKQYLNSRIVTNNATLVLDNVLKNWEIFTYNGQTIESDNEEPIMIKGVNGKILVAVDPKDEIAGNIKKDIPLIFGKSKLLIGISQGSGSSNHMTFDYINFFGNSASSVIVDSEFVLEQFKKYVRYFDKVLIYIIMPFMLILNFFALLLEKMLMVAIVYFGLTSFAGAKTSVKSAIRMVMFSCGLSAFLLPFALISDSVGYIANLSQLWTTILIVLSITSLRPKNKSL